MGNNWPTDFQSNQKTVQGFGAVEGDNNQLVGTRSMLSDSDFIDMLNIDDNETPEWLQEMIANQAQTSGSPPAPASPQAEPMTNAPQTAD
ncbi:hypothetical protein [Paenibacillus andongensis]|uniref:hypothetical protein n=1 Tax=Paenibacillus andongensis TaxID=2975482 RepID=UPI0021BAEEB2|nr:hypothetical protein [Paenibacillus andongensis]